MTGPTLVVLAAGMGSRYGGLKQIDRIGAGGEALLDYSVYDALRAGFEKIVFIIRREIEDDFAEYVLSRMKDAVPYALAFQELDSLVPPEVFAAARAGGRTKPWGTCHALLCAEPLLDSPFTVINADDFYGREAYAVMGEFLRQPGLAEGAIVPYRLEDTLSPRGTVTRGVCAIKDGALEGVEELKAIEKRDGVIFNTGEDGAIRPLPPDTPVSMNFWGFPMSVFPHFRAYFDSFIESAYGQLKSECFIPLAADMLLKNGFLKIRSLDASPEWFGVTYSEDKAPAARRIAELTAAGVYPKRLWTA